ncbi:MAG: BMC domain-containing protein [Planctomycetaceae bacterium]|jgi:microcompartment protein CcmL/EutN|nr:BMC domain-containing protein [Planctomycetaceae bacterium]
MGKSIGAVELSSIGMGYKVQDSILKEASVEILVARTICSGKFFMIFSGGVSDVESAVACADRVGGDAVIDRIAVANAYDGIFPALGQSVVLDEDKIDSLGLIETFSGVSVLVAADYAGKAAKVTLFRLHIAMALGGKGLLLMTGSISDVETSVAIAAEAVRQRGLLVSELVIPRPNKELFQDYL